MFAAGALLRIDFYVIGRFSVGETILLVLAPLGLKQLGSLCSHPNLKYLFYSLLVWILGVFLSDVFNGTPMVLFFRGLARPLLCLGILLASYYLMKKDNRCIYFFFFGLLASGIANFIIPTDFRVAENADMSSLSAMSYGTRAFTLTPLVIGVASVGGFFLYNVSKITSGGFQILIAISVATILSRTTTGILFLSGLLIIVFSLAPQLGKCFIYRGKIRLRAIISLSVMALILVTCFYYIYAYCAYNRILGEDQYKKYLLQTSTVFGNTPWGVLAFGRHYTLGAILRIIDNPIFGAGTWPEAGNTLVRTLEMLGMLKANAAMLDPYRRELGHSVIFGIWAQNGILVLPCMIIALISGIKLFLRTIILNNALCALLLPYLIIFIFSLFFNNFNSLMRVQIIFFPLLLHLAYRPSNFSCPPRRGY